MKKLLFAAAGLAAVAAAAPAAAQGYYGYPQTQPYGYGYNYGDQQGLVRSYIVRADQLRQRIERLDGRDRISEREARALRGAAIELQRRTRDYARNGLSGRERYDLDQRLARLQAAVHYERSDGNNRRWGDDDRRWNDRDGDGRPDRFDDFIDRDRDGVDDRLERRRDRDDD